MVFQLWLMMMGLVLFTISFVWIVQISLFERNYNESVLTDTWSQLEPVMDQLENGEFSDDDQFLPFLSRILDGRLLLLDSDGTPKAFYSYGYPARLSSDSPEYQIWEFLKDSGYQDAISGRESFQHSQIFKGWAVSVILGIPIRYNGKNCYLILHHETMLDTILRMNRRQLLGLSLFLTLAASVLAAVCSRHFTRPIYKIRDAIEKLSESDFSVHLDTSGQDEIGKLSAAVNVLKENLEQVDVLRREVIANVSHELKSPLALISGYAEMVRDIDWRDDKKREDDLNLILQESGRMSEMVNDILDYSKLQSGYTKLNLESFDICELAEAEAFRCRAKAAEYQIRLESHHPMDSLTVQADALKLSQILRNLLYNAINHTPEGGVITIDISPKDGRFRLSVNNPGAFIPEEDRKIIWERYQRSQHQNGRHLGTGIGLSIVSTILTAHQMSYGVDCKNGQTIFWFEF